MNQRPKLDTFTTAYIECALWSSTDESTPSGGYPLDKNYNVSDIDANTLAKMMEDCHKFQASHFDMISDDLGRAGHDFWLTRNRHGVGFSDGDWLEPYATILTDASHAFGEVDLYVSQGRIYS